MARFFADLGAGAFRDLLARKAIQAAHPQTDLGTLCLLKPFSYCRIFGLKAGAARARFVLFRPSSRILCWSRNVRTSPYTDVKSVTSVRPSMLPSPKTTKSVWGMGVMASNATTTLIILAVWRREKRRHLTTCQACSQRQGGRRRPCVRMGNAGERLGIRPDGHKTSPGLAGLQPRPPSEGRPSSAFLVPPRAPGAKAVQPGTRCFRGFLDP